MLFRDFFVRAVFSPPGNLTKIVRIMRITSVILLATCIHLHATGFSQKVNISARNTPLEKVIREVKRQTGLSFFYMLDEAVLKKIHAVDFNVKNVPVTEALKTLFTDLPLDFRIVDGMIVIFEKKKSAENPVLLNAPANIKPPVILLTITGSVLDAKTLEPVSGVTILIKGTKKGVASDGSGKFSITANEKEVLVVSSVGYETQEVTVGNRTHLRILLEVSEASMKDVVITGMFTRKASSFTGATTSFTQDELLKVGSINVLQSLRNLDPAFMVIDNLELGSDPNAIPNIQLRGQSGLPDLQGEYSSNPNLPLFILDGFETSIQKVIDLDIYRVKSINLLKDAASKAIYGSRAANGVVIIETVQPQAGKLRLSYNNNTTLSAPDLSSYNLTNAAEKLEVELAGGVYSATTGSAQYTLKQKYNDNLALVLSGVNTDWLSKPVRNGWSQRHSLRVEGGDVNFRYGIDLMYNNVTGVMKGSDRNTTSAAINLTYRVNKFSFNNILTISNNNSANSPWGSFAQYAAMNPYLPYMDENGNILKVISTITRLQGGGAPGGTANEAVYNPAYNSTLKIQDYSKYTDITNNFNIDWRLMQGLRLVGSMSVTKQFNETNQFYPAEHTMFTTSEFTGDGAARKGRYTKGNGNVDFYSGRVTLNYSKNIDKHYLTFNGGADYTSNQTINIAHTVEGFPNDRLDFISLGLQYLLNSRPVGSENTVKDMSGIISGNYSYDDRYLFDISYRATQSSLYGKDNPWGQFYSVGIGWNLHNESFIQNLSIVDQLRLRATNGYTGSQNFNSTISKATYSYYLANAYSTFGNGAMLIGLANPLLQWQRRQDINLGVDVGIFKRLNVRADYYISTTDGLVTDITLPPSAGFDTYKANLGKAENRGIDLRLDYKLFYNPAKRNSFSIFLLASHNKNTIKEISNSLKSWNASQDAISSNNATTNKDAAKPRVRFIEGQSMNAIWAVKSLGIDPATGREVYQKADGTVTYTWDANDQIVAGDALPKIQGNFGFNLLYSGFSVNTSFRFQHGGQMYNSTLVSKVENASIYQNVDRRVLEQRWRKPGDISFFKDVASTTTTQLSTRFVEDNNQLNFASLNITYDFDRFKKIKSLGFSRLRAGLNLNEVFILSTVAIERGTSYPFARNFQFTLQASL